MQSIINQEHDRHGGVWGLSVGVGACMEKNVKK